MEPTTISIVIPAFNESQRLPGTIRTLSQFIDSRPQIIELIVVDDGSRDLTSSVARSAASGNPKIHVISYLANAGKGYAIRRGVIEARGDVILVSDADLSTPIAELPKLEAALNHADVVIGSRSIPDSVIHVRQAWYRQQMGKTFNWLMRRITGIPFRDTQCGFKLFKAKAAKTIFAEAVVDRFAYDVEMILLAGRHGYRIAEVGVAWYNSPDSRVHVIRDSARMLVDILQSRLRLGGYRDNLAR